MDEDEFGLLLGSARAGDEQAFGALWRRHHARVLRDLTVLSGPDVAEDVASETWLDVARSLGRFQGDEDDFRRWLFTIARRRLIDARRAQARRPTAVGLDDRIEPEAPGSGPAEVAEAASATAEALALIATLKPDQAEIVALRVIGGLDVSAVADLVGKSTGAVRVASHRGLRELADRLSAGEGLPRQ